MEMSLAACQYSVLDGDFSSVSRRRTEEPDFGSPTSTGWGLWAAEELRCIRQVEFVDLLIDLIGRKAGRRHAVAHFISLVRVNCCLGIPVNEHADIRSGSHQPIFVHTSL